MPEITRRRACGLLCFGLSGSSACTPPARKTSGELLDDAERQGLAILDLWAVYKGDRSELSAFTVAGADAGRIVLAGRSLRAAVSPDGSWMAWDVEKSLPRLFVTNGSESARSLSLDAAFNLKPAFIESFALSSGTEHLAIVVGTAVRNARSRGPLRLVVLRVPTLEVEEDVTDVVARLSPGWESQLAVAGLCNHRLLVAFSESFVVIDLSSRSPLFADRGRFPSLSPDGGSVAIVDDRRRLVIVEVSSGARRTPLGRWWRTLGIGGWSPDGRYLLVGATEPLSFSIRLVAVEPATGRFADIMPLGDLVGNGFVWIRRDLLKYSAGV